MSQHEHAVLITGAAGGIGTAAVRLLDGLPGVEVLARGVGDLDRGRDGLIVIPSATRSGKIH
jgi:NAD(P)-dependent dehydrogenase (short-subunit alcohol dehydrogenase family)